MIAFVTGGTGFVGSHLVEELLGRGAEVRGLARGDVKWLAGLPVEIVRGDLADAGALADGCRGADRVFHVAGLTRARAPEALFEANVAGTARVLAAAGAAGVPRTLVTSSLAAVGPSLVMAGRPIPLDETATYRPMSTYGRSKAAMEKMIALRGGHPPTTILRPPAVYGPREAEIFTMIKAAARGVFPIVGRGRTPQLDLVHVHDLVRGMADAAEEPSAEGKTYFLTGERPYAWREIRAAVLAALDRPALQFSVPPAFVGSVGAVSEGIGRLFKTYPPLNREKAREAKATWICSSERARHDFGYRPRIGLEEGMRETIAWYRAHEWL